MSARRKRVISTEEILFNHKPAKMLLNSQNVIDWKKKGVSQTPSITGICSYCELDRPVFELCQTLLHPELTPWWSFLLADGAHHKEPHSPTHPNSKRWDYSDIPGGGHKKIKGPTHMVEVSEWFSLTAFLRTADIEVHIVHTSRVITAYTLKSLSSLT